MWKQTLAEKLKKKPVLLAILLVTFFLKGVVFAAVLPIFQGFDEINHFSNVQYFSFGHQNPPEGQNIFDYSDNLAFNRIRSVKYNTQIFSDNLMGPGEEQFAQNSQAHKLIGYPQKYFLAPFNRTMSILNKILGNESLLVRFFSLRILSVIFGAIAVYLVFLTAKSSGFSEASSLLLASIFAFQPVFTNVSSIINYDIMLVLAFALFAYGAVNLIRGGLSCKFSLISVLAILIGVFTKGTGVILAGIFVPVFLYAFQKKFNLNAKKFLTYLLLFIIIFGVAGQLFSPYSLKQLTRYDQQSHFKTIGHSLGSYASIAAGNFQKYSLTYWGNFGWINAPIADTVLYFIWLIEIVCAIGLLWFFIRRRRVEFLPDKLAVLFFLTIFVALQLGVRFADWRLFDARGHQILGTAGRYFIPALFAHLFLLAIGAGMFLKNEESFKSVLKIATVLMVLLYCYSILNVIIPRYYL